MWRRAETLVFAVALAILAVAYFSNRDMDGKPNLPRGNGRYLPVLARGDGHMMFLMTRSLAFDGDLDFDNDLRRFGDPWHQPRTATGLRDIKAPIGPPLVWAPVLLLARGVAGVANLLGAGIPSHGYTAFHQRFLYTTSVLFALGACLLGWVAARRLVGGRWAPLCAAMAILFGTSLTYYATTMPSYEHAMDAFFVAAFLCLWVTGFGRLSWRRTVALGLLLGLAALIRVQDFPFGVVFAVELAWLVRSPPAGMSRRRWAATLLLHGAVALAIALVMFVPQLAAWHVVYGESFHSQNGPHYVRFHHPQVLLLLFSSRNGWLSTTPLAYAGVVGLFLVPRRSRVVVGALVLALGIQVYLNACIYDWWCSASFGNRRLCSVTFILVVGLAALLRVGGRAAARLRVGRWPQRVVALVILAWFVVWNDGQVLALRHGKAAGHNLGGSPWRGVALLQQELARPIAGAVGNPFAWPASAWFAWRYGVPLTRWDQVAGWYWYEPGNNLLDGAYRVHRGALPLADRLVAGGLGRRRGFDRRPGRMMTGTHARVLVPLLQADRYRVAVPIFSTGAGSGQAGRVAVTVWWNGRQAARTVATTRGWTRVELVMTGHVGTNVIDVEGEPGVVAVGDPFLSFPRAGE